MDWTHLFRKYKGQWVALKEDEKTVISAGSTAVEVLATAKTKGYTDPILTRVPSKMVSLIGQYEV